MARYIELHPVNPQARLVEKVVDTLRDGGLVAYPTDSGYALACAPGNKEGLDRIRTIRQLDGKHNFTFVCADFAQVGPLAIVGNNAFRLIKRLTPGPWTFILKGTKDVPRMTLNPKKHTLGVRIPDHAITQSLVAEFGAPILSSTFIRPGQEEPETNGWEIQESLGHLIDVVIEGPVGQGEPTTVVDLTDDVPEVVREVGKDLDVTMDTGIMHGADIVAAMAMGAKFTFIGRAYLYGLMAGGEAGVTRAIEILAEQVRRTMQLLQVETIDELSPKHVTQLTRLTPRSQVRNLEHS